MPLRPTNDRTPPTEAVGRGAASGLTPTSVRPAPILFGSEKQQNLLIAIARDGSTPIPQSGPAYHRGLVTTGICEIHKKGRRHFLALDARHPAAAHIRAVLSDLAGVEISNSETDGVVGHFDADVPLGHTGAVPFRVMLVIARADGPVDEVTIRRRIPEHWQSTVSKCVDRLVAERVLDPGEGRSFSFAAGVPASFRVLVLEIAEHIPERKLDRLDISGPRAFAFNQAEDGAPRLFGTDARLRNLMALAVHGPMIYRDLRKLTGAYHLHEHDSRNDAPFGRGAVVHTWETPDGTAVALDPDYPCALPLRRLLARLAEIYPFPAHKPAYRKPDLPPRQAWNGDRYVLFGGVIPTTVLVSIGVLGWTFEALVCKIDADRHRENVRTAVTRLEEEGLLQASRPHGPGFNTRVLTIADNFPAKAELLAVLRAYAKAWPDTERLVRDAMHGLAPRSRAHLKKRGLWPYKP